MKDQWINITCLNIRVIITVITQYLPHRKLFHGTDGTYETTPFIVWSMSRLFREADVLPIEIMRNRWHSQGWRQVLPDRGASFPDGGDRHFRNNFVNNTHTGTPWYIRTTWRSALYATCRKKTAGNHWEDHTMRASRAKNVIFSSCISLLDRKTPLPWGNRGF